MIQVKFWLSWVMYSLLSNTKQDGECFDYKYDVPLLVAIELVPRPYMQISDLQCRYVSSFTLISDISYFDVRVYQCSNMMEMYKITLSINCSIFSHIQTE